MVWSSFSAEHRVVGKVGEENLNSRKIYVQQLQLQYIA